MAHHDPGLHHFHKRKRIYKKKEPYPHPDRLKRVMDRLIYLVGIMGPVMTIPQLMQIWVERTAAGVSPISWGAYLIVALFWVMYGIIHKEKPIIIIYSAWVVLDIFIVAGTLLYG